MKREPAGATAWEISPQQVKAMMDRGEAFALLDCRTPEEHAQARIAGAMLVPVQELTARLEELREHEDAPIVVHCHHGQRSMNVVAAMRKYGFPYVKSMAGGIDRWSLEVDPSVPRYS